MAKTLPKWNFSKKLCATVTIIIWIVLAIPLSFFIGGLIEALEASLNAFEKVKFIWGKL